MRGPIGKYFIRKGRIDEHAMLGLPAYEVNALVDGNTLEPTVELGSSLEGIEALVGFEEHFLREV